MPPNQPLSNLPALSSRAFWDINMQTLDFTRHATFIIVRIFERGTPEEREEIVRYYGKDTVIRTLTQAPSLLLPARLWAQRLLGLSEKDFVSGSKK